MIIFIILMMLTSWYLWHRRNGAFLVLDVSRNPKLGKIFITTSIALLITSVMGIIILFMNNKYANLVTLILGSVIISVFAVLISQNNQ